MLRLRIGVIGHVEHVTLGRVPALPRPGDIAHLQSPEILPGGGGGIAFFQLIQSAAEVHLFTAIGDDDAGRFVAERLAETAAVVHIARRAEPHTRDLVMIDPAGERTIVVIGEPLHPTLRDPLPWSLLADLDGVYFTAQDPEILIAARACRRLLATARRKAAILASGIAPDVIVGSASDPREASVRSDFPNPPAALVMTEGAAGGTVHFETGIARFTSPPAEIRGGAYGAGDSFAAALAYYTACGLDPVAAAGRAATYGAAVLADINPLRAQRPLA